jgi:hypothetical protein
MNAEEGNQEESMRRNLIPTWIISVGFLTALSAFVSPTEAQVRGVWNVGSGATNSGVTPASGLTYANTFFFYSRSQLNGPNGEIVGTGEQSVMLDVNNFTWVSNWEIGILGGAKFSVAANPTIANNSLTSDDRGTLGGGGAFADFYVQPFILGWKKKRADIRAIYGFLAPTGRFNGGASNNVGNGYWVNALSAGETFYLTENKATAVSAFEMYEFHGTQRDTQIHPGQNVDLDYSITQSIPLSGNVRLQLGLVGYEQLQTTDKTGPGITPAQAATRYRVNALGFASNVILPDRKVSVGAKYFKEFSNRSTYEGYSLQISAAITF